MNQNGQLALAERKLHSANLCLAVAVFLAVLAVYLLASPGRIDSIDGQIRYEVTMNWLMMGRPVLMDPALAYWSRAAGKKGFTYAHYGPAASVAAMPLVRLGTSYDDPPGEVTRFLFSLTASVFGALAAGILYLFYVELGIAAKKALAWTGVTAFATLMWPTSETVLDNAQHTCLVLAAVFFGFASGKRRSLWLAALGGLVAGLLFTYQEYFALIIPLLALSTLDSNFWARDGGMSRARVFLRALWPVLKLDIKGGMQEFKKPSGLSPEEASAFRGACWRVGLFLLASIVGVTLELGYNYLRFGSWLDYGRIVYEGHQGPRLLGNPLAGLLTLLVSPGKSILLYSPPIVLGLAGIRRLWRQKPQIGCVIVATSVVLVLFISTISFAGGDWCWGPRYLAPLVPLWALAFPYALIRKGWRRSLATGIVGLGLIVQCLGVSGDTQRFFLERGLEDWFWAKDPWFYFKHSALTARFGEALSLINGPPAGATLFNTYNNPPTYATLGPPWSLPRSQAPQWMRHFRVYYVPRPWPIWMWDIPPDLRGINLEAWLAGTLGLGLLGFALMRLGLQGLAAVSGTAGPVAAERKGAYAEQ